MSRLTDEQLVELGERIVENDSYLEAFIGDTEVTQRLRREHSALVDSFFAAIASRPQLEEIGWVRFLMCYKRIQFDPTAMAHWDAYSDRNQDRILYQSDAERDEMMRVIEFKVATVEIKRELGPAAAMLFKLSDGNMDPRK